MRVEDFNKDGLDDFAELGNIYLSNGNGSATATAGVNNFWSSSAFYEDFDNDGIADIRTFDPDFGMWTNYFGAAKSVNRLNLIAWSSASEAQEFLPILDAAIQTIQTEVMALSSASLQLERSRDSQVRLSEALIDANESLRSFDYAQATAEVTKLQIMAQAQMAAITQANMNRRSVLLLLEPFA
jgi:flagellin